MRIFGYRVPGTRDKDREIELLKEKVREIKEEIREVEEDTQKRERELAVLRSRKMDALILLAKENHN